MAGLNMTKKRIGLFGGTFDPPHIGHLILAAEARDQLDLDCTIWILTPDPPHKHGKEISSLEDRLNMVALAISQDDAFSLSHVDIDRPGPHYAVDTMTILRELYSDQKLFYLMGGDSLANLPEWHRASDFLAKVDGIGVMRRPEDEIDVTELMERLPKLDEKLHFVTAPLLEISANQIRWRAKLNRAFRYYLLPSVYDYIRTHKIYQSSD
jgi:nicotinate-nucleotide adenylyltransferase